MCRLMKLASLALMLAVTGFSSVSSLAQRVPSREARVPGLLDLSSTNSAITAPSTVQVGESFQVTVITTGGGCEQKGDVSVILGESEATLMVYDTTVATRPGVACTMIFKRLSHTATLRFTKSGEAVIRVWGRRVASDTPQFGVPTVIEHRLRVE